MSVPPDIRKAARAVVERGYDEGLLEAVERALMAEREKAATIADRYNRHDDDDILEPEYATGRNVTAQFIAADIRRGTS